MNEEFKLYKFIIELLREGEKSLHLFIKEEEATSWIRREYLDAQLIQAKIEFKLLKNEKDYNKDEKV